MQRKLIIGCVAMLGLGACGDTVGEQALVGGLLGGGAAIATDGDVTTGIVGGAAVNVAVCQTDPSKCDDAGLL